MGILRLLLRILAVLLLIVLLPLIGLFVYNRIDEAPSAQARVWAEQPPRHVPDADNAWLYLYGIGAAEHEDPIAFGRRRLDAYEARVAKAPDAKADEAELALANVLPFEGPDGAALKYEDLCSTRESDCVAWAAEHGPLLAEVERRNPVRLARYQTLLGMKAFEEAYAPALDDPVPDTIEASFDVNLIARDISRRVEPDRIMKRLLRGVGFWRMVGARGETILPKMFSDSYLEHHWRLLDALSDRMTRRQHAAYAADIAAVLEAPGTEQKDLRPPLRYQFQRLERLFRVQPPPPFQALMECRAPGQKDSCLSQFLMSSGYARQATINDYARHMRAAADWFEAEARDYERAQEVYGDYVKRVIPLSDSNTGWTLLKYNMTGKVLSFIAIPKLDWAGRKHDREGLRRMFALKMDARAQGLQASAMPAFLANQGEALRNPYTGEAFGWDEQLRAITFKPSTDYWKVELLRVPYAPVK